MTITSADPELEAALACGAARQNTNPCDVATCFNEYLAHTTPADVSPAAREMLSNATAACRPAAQQDLRAAEERALLAARQCAVQATDCVVKSCYAGYLSEFGATGGLRGFAQNDISRAEQRCTRPPPSSSVADGTYNAKSDKACGATSQFGIHIAIKGGAISWEHDFRGISYKWSGTIDPTGGIRASVGNSTDFVADGRYSEAGREILMHYPQCGTAAITLSILGRL